MLRSLNSGVSGLQQFQEQMDVIGNNIANVNTIGFKSGRVEFADAFSQTLQGATDSTGATGSVAPMQIGTGVTTGGITNIYTQGAVSRTNNPLDVAISGEGFFLVRDPASGATYASRAGNFKLTNDGYLVTNEGMRVQGFSDMGLTTRGDVQINADQRPTTADQTARIKGFSIAEDGQVTVTLADNKSYTRGQILLQQFTNPQALLKEGNNLYSNTAAAGPLGGDLLGSAVAPSQVGSDLVGGALEGSNVDLAKEFTTMITSQRAFQANARIITTSDEMLQEVVNIIR